MKGIDLITNPIFIASCGLGAIFCFEMAKFHLNRIEQIFEKAKQKEGTKQ